LLRPVLERQVIYNFANTRVVQTLSIQLQKLQENQQNLEKKIKSEFSSGSPEVRAQLETQQNAIAAFQSEIEQIKAVQQQHTAILEKITAQVLDRQQ
jgi:predicted  nucleic acid-binding Zn-ribbon protein